MSDLFLVNLEEMPFEENNKHLFEYVLSKNLLFDRSVVQVDTRTGNVTLHHSVEFEDRIMSMKVLVFIASVMRYMNINIGEEYEGLVHNGRLQVKFKRFPTELDNKKFDQRYFFWMGKKN